MKRLTLLGLVLVGIAGFATNTYGQVVPYRVTGTVSGNLATGEATGDAVGLHFGQLTFEIFSSGLDVQTAADGSELWLMQGDVLVQEFFPVEGGLFEILIIDEWHIIGGTGRFADAAEANGPIISTAYTDPIDLANPVGTAEFQKLGKINLGKRRN